MVGTGAHRWIPATPQERSWQALDFKCVLKSCQLAVKGHVSPGDLTKKENPQKTLHSLFHSWRTPHSHFPWGSTPGPVSLPGSRWEFRTLVPSCPKVAARAVAQPGQQLQPGWLHPWPKCPELVGDVFSSAPGPQQPGLLRKQSLSYRLNSWKTRVDSITWKNTRVNIESYNSLTANWHQWSY